MIIAAAALVLIGGGLGIVLSRNSRPETKEASLTKEQKELYRMAGPHIETQKERIERVRMEATAAGYPEGVIELLDKNPATVSYVEDYGEKQGQIYAED